MNRLSPSSTFTIRRGAPTRRMIAVAAAGSVGETIAPSTNETGHGSPIRWWAISATATIVSSTSPIALSAITRASARRLRRSPKKADE